MNEKQGPKGLLNLTVTEKELDEQEWMEKRQEKKGGEEEKSQSDEFSFWFGVCRFAVKAWGRFTQLETTAEPDSRIR